MIETRLIQNDDFLTLTKLNYEMYKSIDISINEYGATATLMHYTNQPDFLALGLYDTDILIGFVHGYSITRELFYFSGIYLQAKNTINTKKLIDNAFEVIKNKGYKAWQVDATNDNIASIMDKYGASIKYTRYYKELN